jgi:streptogramin lyase
MHVLVRPNSNGPAVALLRRGRLAQLPAGWNFGEVAAVDGDTNDNVWVLSDGPHPVMQFDKSGKFLRAWPEFLGKKPHGLRVGPDGNIWTFDLEVHRVMKWTQEGRLLMNLGTAGVSW